MFYLNILEIIYYLCFLPSRHYNIVTTSFWRYYLPLPWRCHVSKNDVVATAHCYLTELDVATTSFFSIVRRFHHSIREPSTTLFCRLGSMTIFSLLFIWNSKYLNMIVGDCENQKTLMNENCFKALSGGFH